MNIELFVVQRCWYSSPRQIPSVDYLRLFETRSDAEQAAHHSAHAWARQHHGGSSNSNKTTTLLMPNSPTTTRRESSACYYNKNNGTTTSTSTSMTSDSTTACCTHGFIANGALFWVRSVTGLINILPRDHHSSSNSSCSSRGGGGGEDHYHDHTTTTNSTATNNKITHAYVVVTEGVIGGTGNRNSRRGTEISSGRVFLSTNYKDAQHAAQQACHHITAHLIPQGCHPSQVVLVPVGRPEEYSSQTFLKDWPPSPPPSLLAPPPPQQQQQQQQVIFDHYFGAAGDEHNRTMVTTTSMMPLICGADTNNYADPSSSMLQNKRDLNWIVNEGNGDECNTANNDGSNNVFFIARPPTNKRRRFFDENDDISTFPPSNSNPQYFHILPDAAAISEDEMLTN